MRRGGLAVVVIGIACATAAAPALAAPGDITTVAGSSSTAGYTGDGHAATLATLAHPDAVSPLPGGGFLIADTNNNVIREVSPSGVITTVAGTGTSGYNGDNQLATKAELDGPRGVVALPNGASSSPTRSTTAYARCRPRA